MKIYNGIIAFFIFGAGSAQKLWSFNDCLSYARENNLQVIASKLNEQVQDGNYKIAKKQKLPDVTGAANTGFQFGPRTENALTNPRNKGGYQTVYVNDLAINSSILLYNNGKLKISEEKNDLLVQQYKFTTEKIKNDISLQLIGNYLTVLLNRELIGVSQNSMDTYVQQANRNQKLYDAGSIPLSTLYESNASLANAKQEYETSMIEANRSLMVLAMLLQKDYRDFDIETVKVPDNIELPLISIDDIIQYSYGNQPEIKSAEIAIEAAKKDIDIAKADLMPTITGGYKVGTSYQDSFDRKDNDLWKQWYDSHTQAISLGISVPIFNKGISKLKIEQSKIQQNIQENQLDQEKLTLKQSIETAYFDVNSSYQTFISSKESVASMKLSYEFAQKSFSAGKLNVYDLNIARNNYFNAQSQMLQAKYSFLFRLKILDFYAGKPLQITSNEIASQNYYQPTVSEPEIAQPEENTASVNEARVENNNTTENTVTTPSVTQEQEVKALEEVPVTNITETPASSENVVSEPTIQENPVNTPEEAVAPETFTPSESQPEVVTPTEEINNTIQTPSIPEVKEEIVKTEEPKATSALTDENARREALIKERRAKLSQGSSATIDNAERERLIKERRAKLSKGLE